MALQTGRGLSSCCVDLVTVLPGLLMVKFLRSSGSVAAFQDLCHDLLEDPACQELIMQSGGQVLQS